MKTRPVLARLLAAAAAIAFLAATAPAAENTADRDTLYQVSLLNALMKGEYDGIVPLSKVRQRGDFGLGTYHAVDGEMVLLDGKFYQVLATSEVRIPSDDLLTPFAAVTFFDTDLEITGGPVRTLAELGAAIDRKLPTTNTIYAIRIDGLMDSVHLRSPHAQTPPYRPLNDVVAEQSEWTLTHTTGTLVGLRCPPFTAGLNVAGYHWHFITADGTKGGHVLGAMLTTFTAKIDRTDNWELLLPDTPGFNAGDFSNTSNGTTVPAAFSIPAATPAPVRGADTRP